jgi:hypothetical protein
MKEKCENEEFLIHKKFLKKFNEKFFEYQNRVVIVKSQSSRDTRKLQIIDDFGAES